MGTVANQRAHARAEGRPSPLFAGRRVDPGEPDLLTCQEKTRLQILCVCVCGCLRERIILIFTTNSLGGKMPHSLTQEGQTKLICRVAQGPTDCNLSWRGSGHLILTGISNNADTGGPPLDHTLSITAPGQSDNRQLSLCSQVPEQLPLWMSP